jgi:hypothetical protein
VRTTPVDVRVEQLQTALFRGWGLRADSLEHLPVGGGSHHWRVVDPGGRPHFVTVDDLDHKEWLGDRRADVFAGLITALEVSGRLRRVAGLRFVVAPVPARDGAMACRLDDRYTVSVFPFLPGDSFAFGPFVDPVLRGAALDVVAALHRSTDAVRVQARAHALGYGGQRDLEDVLRDPAQPWRSGPFAEPARALVAGQARAIAELVDRFNALAARTAASRQRTVITHGEPHPGNFVGMSSGPMLVDWDTAALGPPERDLSLLVEEPGTDLERYQDATGFDVDLRVITLYRLRWYLDDLGSAVRLFRHPHVSDEDTRRWWAGLVPQIARLPEWLGRVDET